MHDVDDQTMPTEDDQKSQANHDKLITTVNEVENVTNSRPLSCMTSDDLEQPLTPAHLLSGLRLLSLPDGICLKDYEDDTEVTAKHLSRKLVYLNRVLDEFWKQWRNEYLLELRNAHR